jgi:glycosyltransferase involved in cell wall biosynthesis
LLCISDDQLPENMDSGWDICLAHGSQLSPPKLSRDQQGWLVSRDIRTLFAAMDIQVRSRQLRSMEMHIAEPGSTGIKITVIICVYRGDWGLEKALHAISHQTMAHQDYEVLVVDNNPEGVKSASLIDRLRSEEFDDFPGHLRLLYCPIPGLSYARNAGIAEAGGELVLFLDDDAIARDDLLDNYWSAFSDHPEAGVIGGHIVLELPAELSIPWKHGWERYWSQFVTNHPGYTTVEDWWDFPWGANWCAKRQALLQVGGFRGKYGRRGNDYYGGEEIVAANQIQSLGYSVGVLPQAEVLHRVNPDRFTLEHLKRTIRAGVFAQYQAQISLHLPKNRSAGGGTRKILAGLRDMTSFLLIKKEPEDRAGSLETYASLGAHLELFWRKIIDDFQRVRIHG